MKKECNFLLRYIFMFMISLVVTKTEAQDITLFDKSRINGRDRDRIVFIDPSISNQISYLENEGSEFDTGNFYDRAYRMAKTEHQYVPVEHLDVPSEDNPKVNVYKRNPQTIRKRNLVPEVPPQKVRTIKQHLQLDNIAMNELKAGYDLKLAKKKRRSLPIGGKPRQRRLGPLRLKDIKRNAGIQKEVLDKSSTLTSNKRKHSLNKDSNVNRRKRNGRFKQQHDISGIRKRRSVTSEDRSRLNNKGFKTQDNDLEGNENYETGDNEEKERIEYKEDGQHYNSEEEEPKWVSTDSEDKRDDYRNVDFYEDADERNFAAEEHNDKIDEKNDFQSNEDLNSVQEADEEESLTAEENEDEIDEYENRNHEKRHFHSKEDLDKSDDTLEEESFATDGKFDEVDYDLERNEYYNKVHSNDEYAEVGDTVETFGERVVDPNSDAERKKTERYLSKNEVQPVGRCGHEKSSCEQREGCEPPTTEEPDDCEMKPHHRPNAKNRCKPKPHECCVTEEPRKKRVLSRRPKRLIWLFNPPWRWGRRKQPCQNGCPKPKGDCGTYGRCKVHPVK